MMLLLICIPILFIQVHNVVSQTFAPEDCLLPSYTGMCRAYFPLWYYDASKETCATFTYGGCGRNNNAFSTEQDCYNACAGVVLTRSSVNFKMDLFPPNIVPTKSPPPSNVYKQPPLPPAAKGASTTMETRAPATPWPLDLKTSPRAAQTMVSMKQAVTETVTKKTASSTAKKEISTPQVTSSTSTIRTTQQTNQNTSPKADPDVSLENLQRGNKPSPTSKTNVHLGPKERKAALAAAKQNGPSTGLPPEGYADYSYDIIEPLTSSTAKPIVSKAHGPGSKSGTGPGTKSESGPGTGPGAKSESGPGPKAGPSPGPGPGPGSKGPRG